MRAFYAKQNIILAQPKLYILAFAVLKNQKTKQNKTNKKRRLSSDNFFISLSIQKNEMSMLLNKHDVSTG